MTTRDNPGSGVLSQADLGADPAAEVQIRSIRMAASVVRQILGAVGSKPPENGMLLGGDPADGIVRHVVFDDGAKRSGCAYSPDHVRLNALLTEWWQPSGIRLLGFVHSHPGQFPRPSGGDLEYAETILEANPHLDRLLLPIVTVDPKPALHPFVAVRTASGVEALSAALEVLDEVLVRPRHDAAFALSRSVREQTFRRVRTAYDLPHLSFCRLFVVGCGGSAASIEDAARIGVGEFVLIDGDRVSRANVATQGYSQRDLDRLKVEALRDRILEINPLAAVLDRPVMLDELDDAEVESLLGLNELRPPIRTLVCAFSDSFAAQARATRVALQHGLPYLAAQLYEQGRAGELVFSHPETTPACPRCVLAARYATFGDGYRNTVTSDGTPIYATARLNSLKLAVLLALLHHGTAHPRWGGLLRRIGNRNLVQIRMDPDVELPVFDRVFCGDRERVLMDEAVWLPQVPEDGRSGRPRCPDCGGTGDLRSAIGSFADTRLPR